MKNIPLALILEKNKLSTPNPWLMLLDVVLNTTPDPTQLSLVNNTEQIVFQGTTYQPFPFQLDVVSESSDGKIPSIQLKMSNVTGIIQGYIEQIDGGVDSDILITMVNAALLSENYAELQLSFSILETLCDANWVTFTLGAPNPLRADFPPDIYLADQCSWARKNRFKGPECGYSGPSQVCNGTLDYCRQLNNAARFGGFPGLQGGGIRLA